MKFQGEIGREAEGTERDRADRMRKDRADQAE